MALVYVGGTSGSGTSSGYTVSLNGTLTGGIASSPATGDLIVVFSAFGNTASSAPSVSGNNFGTYNAATAAQHVNDTWDTEFRSFYAYQSGTADTTLTVTRATNTAYGGATVVQVWRGADPTSHFIGAATPASGSNGNAINPPAYDPGVTGSVVIAGGAGTLAAAAASGYTGFSGASHTQFVRADGSTADIGVVMGSFDYAGSSIDPPAVTGATTSTSASWAGVTLAIAPQPEAVDYPLDASAGSYSLAGGAAVLSFGHNLSASAGSYAHSGESATLVAARAVSASAGSYSLAGGDAVLIHAVPSTDYPLTASPGEYALAGGTASLRWGASLVAQAGSYAITGGQAAMLAGRTLAGQPGAYAVNGGAAGLSVGLAMQGQAGTYSLDGGSASLLRSASLTAQPGSYAISGGSAAMSLSGAAVDYPLMALPGAYAISGGSASAWVGRDLAGGAGAYALAGGAAAMAKGKVLTADAGSYTLAGGDATLVFGGNFVLMAQPGSYTVTGGDAVMTGPQEEMPVQGGGRAPFRFVPAVPVAPYRTRKRRHADLLFIRP